MSGILSLFVSSFSKKLFTKNCESSRIALSWSSNYSEWAVKQFLVLLNPGIKKGKEYFGLPKASFPMLLFICVQKTLPFTLYTQNLTKTREQIICKRHHIEILTGYVNQDVWFKRGLTYL